MISGHLPMIAVHVDKVHYYYEKIMSSYRLNKFPLQRNKPIYNLTFFVLKQILILIINN